MLRKEFVRTFFFLQITTTWLVWLLLYNWLRGFEYLCAEVHADSTSRHTLFATTSWTEYDNAILYRDPVIMSLIIIQVTGQVDDIFLCLAIDKALSLSSPSICGEVTPTSADEWNKVYAHFVWEERGRDRGFMRERGAVKSACCFCIFLF